MKKVFPVLLALCLICGCLLPPVYAETPTGTISVRLRSDIAGCTRNDYRSLIEILSDNVVYSNGVGGDPVLIADSAGNTEYAHLAAGRTYYLHYLLEAAPGYVLPDAPDVRTSCGKGVSVTAVSVVSVNVRTDEGESLPFRGLEIQAKVVVDGNVLQRIMGFFTDLILKIKAWSLY